MPVPHSLPISSHCHWLITGSSGSGKSQSILYLGGCLLQEIPDIDLVLCDFKKSSDFMFLQGYPHYYSGNECYDGVMAYYEDFCNARMTGNTTRRHMLIFDEYPAFINYLTTKDKQEKTKKAGEGKFFPVSDVVFCVYFTVVLVFSYSFFLNTVCSKYSSIKYSLE